MRPSTVAGWLWGLCLLGGLSLPSLAEAGVAESPAPPTETRKVEGKSFVLLGSGSAGEYQLSLYVEETEARRHFPALVMRAGGKGRAKLNAGDHAQTFVVWGRFTKLLILRPAHPLVGTKLREMFATALVEELADKASPEVKQRAEALLALLARDLVETDELQLLVDGDGRVTIDLHGDRRDAPPSPRAVRDLLSLWLGPKAVSAELRRALVDKIELLGK